MGMGRGRDSGSLIASLLSLHVPSPSRMSLCSLEPLCLALL